MNNYSIENQSQTFTSESGQNRKWPSKNARHWRVFSLFFWAFFVFWFFGEIENGCEFYHRFFFLGKFSKFATLGGEKSAIAIFRLWVLVASHLYIGRIPKKIYFSLYSQYFFKGDTLIGPWPIFLKLLGIPHKKKLDICFLPQNGSIDIPFDTPFTLYIYGNWIVAKQYGTNLRCKWECRGEHLGNPLENWWEYNGNKSKRCGAIGNILGEQIENCENLLGMFHSNPSLSQNKKSKMLVHKTQ